MALGFPGDPELVETTPLYIGGRLFDPKSCVHDEDYSGDAEGNHNCCHDWRIYWGNQARPS